MHRLLVWWLMRAGLEGFDSLDGELLFIVYCCVVCFMLIGLCELLDLC